MSRREYAEQMPPQWDQFLEGWYNERPVTHIGTSDLFLIRRDAPVAVWPGLMLPNGWSITTPTRAWKKPESGPTQQTAYAIVGECPRKTVPYS